MQISYTDVYYLLNLSSKSSFCFCQTERLRKAWESFYWSLKLLLSSFNDPYNRFEVVVKKSNKNFSWNKG